MLHSFHKILQMSHGTNFTIALYISRDIFFCIMCRTFGGDLALRAQFTKMLVCIQVCLCILGYSNINIQLLNNEHKCGV